MTAEHRIIPLGLVIGQGEKEKHYRFLLESMKHAMPKQVTIFSDQTPGILGAIDKALSDIECHKKPCAWYITSKLPVPKKALMQLLKMDNRAVMSSLLVQLTDQYPLHAGACRPMWISKQEPDRCVRPGCRLTHRVAQFCNHGMEAKRANRHDGWNNSLD